MSLFGQSKRPMSKSGRRHGLPLSTADSTLEKPYSHSRSNSLSSPLTTASTNSGWFTILYIPVPNFFGGRRGSSSSSGMNGIGGGGIGGVGGGGVYSYPSSASSAYPPQTRRHIRVYLPIPHAVMSRIPFLSRPTPLRLLTFLLLIVTAVLVFTGLLGKRRRERGGGGGWTEVFRPDKNSVVLTKEEIARIWEWEVLSGHHPSLTDIPESIPFMSEYENPAIPPREHIHPHQPDERHPRLAGSGSDRHYLPIRTPSPPWKKESHPANYHEEDTFGHSGFPPRPVSGSIIDLDMVLKKCDLDTSQHVRDCLEYLRIGGHLDAGKRLRRTNLTAYEHIFTEDRIHSSPDKPLTTEQLSHIMLPQQDLDDQGLPVNRLEKGLSRDPLSLGMPMVALAQNKKTSKSTCDPAYPRVFHMFWAGPFTDKPYMAVMSFLFTQNLGLDQVPGSTAQQDSCRPQFWVWINPGPAAAVPNPSARREMYEQLAINPWSSPFLHARFQDVVKFKMWNSTEQLDGVDELRDHWRDGPIFNSGGNTYGVPQAVVTPTPTPSPSVQAGEGIVILNEGEETSSEPAPAPILKKKGNDIYEKVGSTSQNDYDRLSVILSDIARFILTHRYGGIYIDADTVFLRDWEELWNWKGQFAYRWSWHQKYNTAVIKLHKGSALGKFLFKTALENGMDFHPMTISKYLQDAGLDDLLFRIPDALFDSAWLNMEGYQRDRPPFPYFPEFSEFFSNNKMTASGPHPLGYDGFFRGSFSYHFHNFWWLPFDPSRNWPDLGKRFIKGERSLRQAARAAKILQENPGMEAEVDVRVNVDDAEGMDEAGEDEADLSWSTVLKRTFEAYVRSERPNMYGEWLRW